LEEKRNTPKGPPLGTGDVPTHTWGQENEGPLGPVGGAKRTPGQRKPN